MDNSEEYQLEKNSGCAGKLFILGAVLAFWYVFRMEIGALFQALKFVYQQALGAPQIEFPANTLYFTGILGVILLVWFVLLLIGISQVVFPVKSIEDRLRAFERLRLFLAGSHGRVVFVRNGAEVPGEKNERSRGPGIAMVDASSAIVWESKYSLTPIVAPSLNGSSDHRSRARNQKGHSSTGVRVTGPGLFFMRGDERLRGVADLRKQFRLNPQVKAYTSDGIEVQSNIVVAFTLGRAASLLRVVCLGDSPADVRVVRIDDSSRKIRAFADELDAPDKAEIFSFCQEISRTPGPTADLAPEDDRREYPPYVVDAQRIFAAIYSQAQRVNSAGEELWTDLPARVATEVFRNMISRLTYDALVVPDAQGRVPWKEVYKPAFSHVLRNNGIMAYQLLMRRDGSQPEVGQTIHRSNFYLAPAQCFTNPKVLRERGIRVLFASFSEVKPTNEEIHEQRVESWCANWRKETEITRSDYDLEAGRIRNRARAETQKEMLLNLTHIFQSAPHSQEALAMRLYQALEDAILNPSTQPLMPNDTLAMLRSLRDLLIDRDERQRPLLGDQRSP